MFHLKTIRIGNAQLQIFQGNADQYTTIGDLAAALDLEAGTIRAELSDSLLSVPALHAWLVEQEILSQNSLSSKARFIPSRAWTNFIQDRVPMHSAALVEEGAALEDEQKKGRELPNSSVNDPRPWSWIWRATLMKPSPMVRSKREQTRRTRRRKKTRKRKGTIPVAIRVAVVMMTMMCGHHFPKELHDGS